MVEYGEVGYVFGWIRKQRTGEYIGWTHMCDTLYTATLGPLVESCPRCSAKRPGPPIADVLGRVIQQGLISGLREVESEYYDRNIGQYIKESALGGGLVRVNRHNIHTGEWYGPSPEPDVGSPCPCPVCELQRGGVERTQARPNSDD